MAIMSVVLNALQESITLQIFAAVCALSLVSQVVLHAFQECSIDLASRSIQLRKPYTIFISIHSPNSLDPSFGLPLACLSFIAS